MKKKNVGVIGAGKWGKKIIKVLKQIANIKYVYNSKKNYQAIKEDISWVFILAPNKYHFEMTKFFLKKRINVFCEKPLTTNVNDAKKLIRLSKKLKTKLYIDDIDIYKKKKIRLNKNFNSIIRTKKDTGSAKSLLHRLAYHDFYLLSKFINIKNIKEINIKIKAKILKITIVLKDKLIFNFLYSVNSKFKKHLINNTDFNKFKKNPIKDMLKSVLYKNISFKRNNEDALKCILLIDMIKKKI
tara:strand:+ start:3007 stop:3732 length:726 start_codon:yes stop_codon:yes gene_type:complete